MAPGNEYLTPEEILKRELHKVNIEDKEDYYKHYNIFLSLKNL